MRFKLATIAIGLLVAAGGSLAACSSSDPVPDEGGAEAVEYTSLEEEQDYQEYDDAEESPGTLGGMEAEGAQQPGMQPGQQPQAGAPPEATGPVATVDGQEVSAEDFNQHVEMIVQQSGGQIPPQMMDDIRDGVVEQLVQEKLLVNAIDKAGIDVDDEEVDKRIAEYRAEIEESPFGQDMSLEEMLTQQGMNMDEFRELIEQEVAMTTLIEKEVAEMPTDEDVRAYYDDNPERFTVPESVEARQILAGVGMMAATAEDEQAWAEAEETIEEIHEALQEDDADFEAIAAEYGENVVTQEGPIHRNEDLGAEVPPQYQQPQELEDTAFALEDGELSDPIRLDHGWLIIERVEHRDEQVEAFEEVEAQLEEELRNQAMAESIDGYIAQLEDDAEVEIHPENIQ